MWDGFSTSGAARAAALRAAAGLRPRPTLRRTGHDADHVRDRPLAPVAVVLPEAGLVTSGKIEIDGASMNGQARLRAALDVHRAGDVQRKGQQIRVEVAHRPRRAREEKQ